MQLVKWKSCQPFILCLLAPACHSFSLVIRNDDLNVDSSLSFTHELFACPALSRTGSVERLSPPLYGLMASLYRRGRSFLLRSVCFHLASSGEEFASSWSLSCQGSVSGLLPNFSLRLILLSLFRDWFLANESHFPDLMMLFYALSMPRITG